MRTIKPVDVRRQEILDGAMRLFIEKGYDKTSISDIAKYLGISQGLCYRYFTSKEEIFIAAIDEYAKSIVDQMLKIITDPKLTLEEKIAGQISFQELEKTNSYYEAFHGEKTMPMHDSLSLNICRRVTPYIQALIDKEIKEGRLIVKDSAMLASCCVYGQLGILLDTRIDAGERTRRIYEFLIDLLDKYRA